MTLDVIVKKKFKIEYILNLHGKTCLFARQLDKSNFIINEGSTIGGVPLESSLSQPRKLLENGKPDLDIFSLFLKNKNDIDKLKVDQIVELN